MKKTILPALAMLIISAVMLSTASYAWFAMSEEVSASNMNVSVTSDAANLIISTTESDVINTTTHNTFDVPLNTTNATELLPVAFDTAKVVNSSSFAPSTDEADKANNTVWYHMTSKAANSHVGDSSTKKFVQNQEFGKYVLAHTVYVGISKGSNEMTNLQAKVTITTPNVDEGAENYVNVLVVSTDLETGYQNFTKTTTGYGDAVVLANSITAANPVQVDIYIYYNGEHSGITSSNLAADAIKDSTVTVFFHADQKTTSN